MQNQEIGKATSKCATCGKPVVIRSVRDRGPQYCSRICSSAARYNTRYRGTMSGPADRPSDPLACAKL